MTDLHVHILPGVDDGSPNLSTSLEMAEMAAQSGVRILAVTPHANQTGIEGEMCIRDRCYFATSEDDRAVRPV